MRLKPWGVGAAAALVVGGVIRLYPVENRRPPPVPFRVVDPDGVQRAGETAATGTIFVVGMATVVVTAPFTLVGVEPLRHDPEFRLLTVRVGFHGRDGSRTASGYLRASTLPGGACGAEPVTGHGPTYPAAELRLRPGDDTARLIYYMAATAHGRTSAVGFRITYRTPDGRTGTVSGGPNREMFMTNVDLRNPPPGGFPGRLVERCTDRAWTTSRPGFPA